MKPIEKAKAQKLVCKLERDMKLNNRGVLGHFSAACSP